MADASILPGTLNLSIYRGNGAAFQATITEAGEPHVLPETGWVAQVRQRAGQSTDEPLATFTIDAADAGEGVIRFSLTGPDTLPLPKKCRWDLENTELDRTFLAGDLLITEQVTQ